MSDLSPEELKALTPEELKALKSLAQFYKMIQGWCRINRWIALTLLAILIALSQGLDAIKNLIGARH